MVGAHVGGEQHGKCGAVFALEIDRVVDHLAILFDHALKGEPVPGAHVKFILDADP
jgi:hypothetical protein